MRQGFTRRPKVEEPAANHEKNYITPGGIERLKAERHFLLTKDRLRTTEFLSTCWKSQKRPSAAVKTGLLFRHVPAPIGTTYYIAPPAMVAAMRQMLLAANVDEDDIRTEEFSGY